MRPVYSRGSRPDYSGTPRGYRTPRGEHPHHDPRGGRSDRSDNRQGYFRRRDEKEARDRNLDEAFNAPLAALRINTADFKEALCLVLRKRTALRSLKDYHEILNDEAYQRGSKHYSYLFRRSILSHRDGSLSLNEMLHHRDTTQKLKHMRDNCDQRVLRVDKSEVQDKSLHSAIQFLLPAAHLCCDSNKSRCQVGYITEEDYVPGSLVADEDWFTPGYFEDDERRTAQADLLDTKNIATFFIRF